MLKNLPLNQLLQQIPNAMPNFCDKCGAKHNKEDMEIVAQDAEKLTLRLTCNNCSNTYMIQIQSPSEGVIAARKTVSRSDISVGEMRKFVESENIDNDEILDVVIALKGVSTIKDFEVLFSEQNNG